MLFVDHELNQQIITLFFTRKEPGGLEEQSVLRLDPGLNTARNWHNLFLINFFVTQKMYCYESAGLICVERRYGEWVDRTGCTWLLKVMNFIWGHEFLKKNVILKTQTITLWCKHCLYKNRRTLKCTLPFKFISQVSVVFHDYITFL